MAVVLLAHMPLNAQDENHEYEGSGFGGVSVMSGFQSLTQVHGGAAKASRTVGVNYSSGYQIGARINENVNDFWSADLEYSFSNQPVHFTNLSPDIQTLTLGQSVHHFSYNVSYLAFPNSERFRLYAKAGLGATLFYIHHSSKEEASILGVSLKDTWKFTVNWGGGFKYALDENSVFILDVKDHVSGIPSYGLPSSAQVINGQYRPGLSDTGWLHNVQVNVGFAYRWN